MHFEVKFYHHTKKGTVWNLTFYGDHVHCVYISSWYYHIRYIIFRRDLNLDLKVEKANFI